MISQKIKLGFITGIVITLIFIIISHIINPQSTIYGLILKGIIAGGFGGMITPFSIQKLFKNTLNFDSQKSFEWYENEEIIHRSGAIYLAQHQRAAGELNFTKFRLVFISNSLEKSYTEVLINKDEIKKINTFNPLGSQTQGLEIITIDSQHFSFVVDDAKLWQSVIGKSSPNNNS